MSDVVRPRARLRLKNRRRPVLVEDFRIEDLFLVAHTIQWRYVVDDYDLPQGKEPVVGPVRLYPLAAVEYIELIEASA